MDRRRPSLRTAAALVLAVWIELALVQSALPGCAGTAASFAGAWALIACTRSPLTRTRAIARGGCLELASFAIAGLALQPWLGLAALRALELATGRAGAFAPGPAPCAWDLASALVLAPIFEERLYRGCLLPALRHRLGAPVAIVASAGFFALPHLTPLHVLGTFLAGLALGVVWQKTRRVTPCVGMHAGFNAAALWQQTAIGSS